jgi:hypothetical protein
LKPFVRGVATGEEENWDETTPETNEEVPVSREALCILED